MQMDYHLQFVADCLRRKQAIKADTVSASQIATRPAFVMNSSRVGLVHYVYKFVCVSIRRLMWIALMAVTLPGMVSGQQMETVTEAR